MSDLVGLLQKKVLLRDSARIVGCINDVYFSKNCTEIAYFVIKCDDDSVCLFPPSALECCEDVVVVQSYICAKKIEDIDFTLFASGLIGMAVYTQSGILKGNIQNADFTKSGKLLRLYTEAHTITPQQVALVGDVILLKPQKRTQKPRKLALPRPKLDLPVSVLEQKEPSTSPQSIPLALDAFNVPPAVMNYDTNMLFSSNALRAMGISETDDSSAITRIISDYSFLLGRVLSKDLYAYSSKLLALEGESVTDEIIQRARLAGKLPELVLIAR